MISTGLLLWLGFRLSMPIWYFILCWTMLIYDVVLITVKIRRWLKR